MIKCFAFFGAGLGLAIPALLLAVVQITDHALGPLGVLLWPSSMILLGNEGHEGEAVVWQNMAIAIGVNVLWYVTLAIALVCLRKAYTRLSGSARLRDEP